MPLGIGLLILVVVNQILIYQRLSTILIDISALQLGVLSLGVSAVYLTGATFLGTALEDWFDPQGRHARRPAQMRAAISFLVAIIGPLLIFGLPTSTQFSAGTSAYATIATTALALSSVLTVTVATAGTVRRDRRLRDRMHYAREEARESSYRLLMNDTEMRIDLVVAEVRYERMDLLRSAYAEGLYGGDERPADWSPSSEFVQEVRRARTGNSSHAAAA